VRRQVRAQLARIVARAVDQRGLAAPQERQAHQVEPRRVSQDAAVVAGAALRSKTGTSTQEWSGRKPVAQRTVRIPPRAAMYAIEQT
jgi:hypothetical protein